MAAGGWGGEEPSPATGCSPTAVQPHTPRRFSTEKLLACHLCPQGGGAGTPGSSGRGLGSGLRSGSRAPPTHPPVNEQAAKRGSDEVGHQRAVVPAHGLQALAVHAVMGVRPGGEEQASIALLADEQVREVDLWGAQG